MLMAVITPSNAAIFPEYIIPKIKYLVQDLEVSVHPTYAQCIGYSYATPRNRTGAEGTRDVQAIG
jgi:hypothetical protein